MGIKKSLCLLLSFTDHIITYQFASPSNTKMVYLSRSQVAATNNLRANRHKVGFGAQNIIENEALIPLQWLAIVEKACIAALFTGKSWIYSFKCLKAGSL